MGPFLSEKPKKLPVLACDSPHVIAAPSRLSHGLEAMT